VEPASWPSEAIYIRGGFLDATTAPAAVLPFRTCLAGHSNERVDSDHFFLRDNVYFRLLFLPHVFSVACHASFLPQ
jgi:hypothetical protein